MPWLLNPLVWVAATASARTVAAHVAWSLRTRAPANPPEAWLVSLAEHPSRVRLVRAALLATPLILAAWLRVAEPAELGLIGPTGPRGVLAALAFAAAAGLLIAAGSASFARSTGAPSTMRLGTFPPSWVGPIVLEAAGLEAYWAFVRGAVLAVGLANGALAVFVALGILGLQAWANPESRAALLEPTHAAALSTAAIKALLSSAVFLACGSSLVAWILHATLSVALCGFDLQARQDTSLPPEPEDPAPEPFIV